MPDLQPINPMDPPVANTPENAQTPAAQESSTETAASATMPDPIDFAAQKAAELPPSPVPPAEPAAAQPAPTIYPIPAYGAYAPAALATAPPNSAPAGNTYGTSSTSLYAQLCVVFGILPTLGFIVLIFVGGLDSRVKLYVTAVLMMLSAAAGLYCGFIANKKDYHVSPLAVIGISASTITILLCLILTSYYIKIEMELNKLKAKYDSSYQSYDDY